MIQEQPRGNLVIFIGLLMALALTVLPLPDFLRTFRPEWTALVLLYWIMTLPYRIGVNTAWILGICLDVLKGSLLGQHALAMAVIAFLMLHMHLRIRIYPLWQQAIMIGLMLLIYQAILLWIYGVTGTLSPSWSYWAPSLVGALLWPWIYVILRDIRQRYQVR